MEKSNGLHETLSAHEVLDMKNRLDDDFQRLLDARQTLNQTSESGTAEDVKKRIAALKSELVKKSTARSWCELRLKRIEMGRILCNQLFLEEDNDSAVKNNLEKLDLAQQALRIEEETKELEEKFHKQELANCELNTENMELLGKLKESKEKAALPKEVTQKEEYKRLKNELDVRCQSITICQNIIQRLIFGLGVNLEEDEEVENLFKKCCEPLRF
ncbi:hypothetical protein ElyMa_001832800 [Elysia marginata]|uniref:Centromere protein H C-terminal domain-containing protein n=1 Tax=Elysia marginata TaxID=1093978 RepID=A0AAV4EIE5_9GAST|nr:hypothetical protein ElyMa_001832800 [Elysia marginata]